MRMTPITREILAKRRMARELLPEGWEEIGEGGGKLWEIYRGYRLGCRIQDVRIAPDGMSLFVKIEKPS